MRSRLAGLALALVLFSAGSGFAEIDLACPEHTQLEQRQLQKGVEAYCVLGDGTRHGPWGGWYPSGQRAIAGYYEDGRLHGVETEWYDVAELSGWRRFRARFRKPRRIHTEWSRGELHGERVEWDIDGHLLERSTWHRGEFVSYEHPKGLAAADAELGRPFAALHKPKGCFERKYFPSLLRKMMGAPVEGYSGFEVRYGTGSNPCGHQKLPCRSYSRAQLSDIMGHEIQGFADSASFAVFTCRTDEDERRHTLAEEGKWRKRSAVHRDAGVIAFLSDVHGAWCGRAARSKNDRKWQSEVRIEFIPGDPERAALATETWNRVPGGPMGEPGYVMSSLLIPMPREGVGALSADGEQMIPEARQARFKAVSVHRNAGGFVLSTGEQGFVLLHKGHEFPMSQDCEGFWMPPGPDPSDAAAAPETGKGP